MGCNLCKEFHVQKDAEHMDTAERYSPRCVRYAKIDSICWPETNPKVGAERRADRPTISRRASGRVLRMRERRFQGEEHSLTEP